MIKFNNENTKAKKKDRWQIVIDRFDDSYLRLGRKTNEQLGRNWESQTSEET